MQKDNVKNKNFKIVTKFTIYSMNYYLCGIKA